MNIGEEICGEWLRHVRRCEFVQYNLKTPDDQGEIDVIGINLAERVVYACEVAVHLITGLQYVRDGRPDNFSKLTAKFRKDIAYIRKAFPDYKHVFMFWSPVVKNQGAGAKYNQLEDVQRFVETIRTEFDETVELVINETFHEALNSLRSFARKETKELDSSVVRLFQVEEHLQQHLRRLARRNGEPE